MTTPLRNLALSLTSVAALGLAACSGGGGSATPKVSTAATASRLGVTLAGNTSSRFATTRHDFIVSGTPVTVTYNGATVATGTLDSNGFVELVFTQAVPAGSRVIVTIGTPPNDIVASVPLVNAVPATAAYLVFNPGPPATVEVKRGDDVTGTGHYDPSDDEEEDDVEDANTGNVIGSPSPSPSPSASPR